MTIPRKEFDMVVLNSSYIWAAAGLTSIVTRGVTVVQLTSSTEMYNFNTKVWENSLILDMAIAGHCIIKVILFLLTYKLFS